MKPGGGMAASLDRDSEPNQNNGVQLQALRKVAARVAAVASHLALASGCDTLVSVDKTAVGGYLLWGRFVRL